jgi:asparagine synthase (glutamine-hydrolysing)
MCGIAGYIGPLFLKENRIKDVLGSMVNRGPDKQDFFFEKKSYNENVYLFHSRLSILDLNSRSDQPFFYKNYVIIFNGEIYNYKELSSILVKKGVKLKTNSDTEILLHFYIIYKEKCLSFFEGMWSFVIYDTNKKNFFISRDRFGEKPLYFINEETGFYFGSEINYIKKLFPEKLKVDYFQLNKYLVSGYKSLYKDKHTYFQKLKIFPSSTFLSQKNFKKIEFKKFWQLKYEPNNSLELNDIISETRRLLYRSVELRLRSDTPIGLCLSGGLDSSGIASIAKNIFGKQLNTYSIIDNDPRYNESKNIRINIKNLNIKNFSIKLQKENNLNQLKNIIKYKSHPLCTLSYYNHLKMLKKMKSHRIKVCLLGTGADELFAGYYDHFLLHLASLNSRDDFNINKNNFEEFIKPFIRNKLLLNPKKYISNPNDRRHVFDESLILKNFLNKDFEYFFSEKKYSTNLLRNRMLNELFNEITPVILNEDDTNSMYYSIENRSPYLDSNLSKFLFTIPSKFLIQRGFSKFILREALSECMIKDVCFDRRKIGFNSSIDSVFDLDSKNLKEMIFDKKNDEIFEIVNKEKIKKIFKYKNKTNYLSKFIFNVLNAKIFLESNQ